MNTTIVDKLFKNELRILSSREVELSAYGKNQLTKHKIQRRECHNPHIVIQVTFDRPVSHRLLTLAMSFRISRMSK